jgi:hypothetical protein
MAQVNAITVRSIVYMAIKPLRQHLEHSRHQFLRFFADLQVEFVMIVRAHAMLKCLRRVRAIKK